MRLIPARSMARAAIVLLAAISIGTASVEAAAKRRKHVAHRHALTRRVSDARAPLIEGSHLGAMRYFGGPKSPMWREVR